MAAVTLMERLTQAGYPESEMFHHRSDLYVFVTPVTEAVINEWLKESKLCKSGLVSMFRDAITGRPMYDVAFQYTPYWIGHRE